MRIFINWIKNIKYLEGIKSIFVLSVLLLLVLESISSIAYYQKVKSPVQSISSTVSAIEWIIPRMKLSPSSSPRFDRLIKLRKQGVKAYPSYSFKPSLHNPKDFYHLANLPETYTVLCKESGPFVEFTSDELGFRNPVGQLGSNVDFLFIGDSFTEGVCESEDNTFAGIFRKQDKKVFNLGRGGSGPLFNLATLVEYGEAVQANTVVWFVFTGNDLEDLREEKTGTLKQYFNADFSQNLLLQKQAVKENLKEFLDAEIIIQKKRMSNDSDFLQHRGEDFQPIDQFDANSKEVPLLKEVASAIKKEANKNSTKLAIVILNHPRNRNFEIQDITSNIIKEFSLDNKVPYLEFSRDYLADNWEEFYTSGTPHFNSTGSLAVGTEVYRWINSKDLKSKIIKDRDEAN